MARFRTSILLTAICLWLCLLMGCGGTEEPSAPAQQVVKGKIPAVEPKAPAPKPAPTPAPAPKPGPTQTEPAAVKPTPAPAEAPQPSAPLPKDAAAVATTPVPVKSPPPADTAAAPPAPPPASSPPQGQTDAAVSTADTGASAPLPQTPEAGKQVSAGTPESAPDLTNLLALNKPHTYDPEGKIDPFIPVFESQEPTEIDTEKSQAPKRIPQSPLEMVDLSQLKLTGVILASSGNRALVQDATGKGYVVYIGTYLGNREGQVTKILQDRLIVAEKAQDQLGRQVTAEREIKLPKPPGEM